MEVFLNYLLQSDARNITGPNKDKYLSLEISSRKII